MAENANPNGGNGQPGQGPQSGDSSSQAPGQRAGGPSQAGGQEFPYEPSSTEFAQDFKQDPEWKKAQRGYQRQINELQSQLASITQAQEEQRMAGMSEVEKANYAADRWRQAALEQSQKLQEIQSSYAREQDLLHIQSKTGVPAQEIAKYLDEIGSNLSGDAWDYAYERSRNAAQAQPPQPPSDVPQQLGRTQQQTEYRQPPPRVDVGGGQAPNVASQLQQRYDEARKAYNLDAMIGMMKEADQAGVKLNEW